MLEALLFVLNSGANEISARTSLDRQARHIHFAPLAQDQWFGSRELSAFVLPTLQQAEVQGWERVLVQA